MIGRYGSHCHYCGVQTWVPGSVYRDKILATFPEKSPPGKHRRHAIGGRMFTIEHLDPQENGGTNSIGNLRPSCHFCNVHRGHACDHETYKKYITWMKSKGIHPHQIFARTGVWMTPTGTDFTKFKQPKKETL